MHKTVTKDTWVFRGDGSPSSWGGGKDLAKREDLARLLDDG